VPQPPPRIPADAGSGTLTSRSEPTPRRKLAPLGQSQPLSNVPLIDRRFETTPNVRRRYVLEEVVLRPMDAQHRHEEHLTQTKFFDYLQSSGSNAELAMRSARIPEPSSSATFEDADGNGAELADPQELLRWVHGVQPKSRLDAYPLFIMVRDLLERVLEKEVGLVTPQLARQEQKMGHMHERHSTVITGFGRIVALHRRLST